jgi:hypothetical protein
MVEEINDWSVRLAADCGNTCALELARLRAAAMAMAIVGGVFIMRNYFSHETAHVKKFFQKNREVHVRVETIWSVPLWKWTGNMSFSERAKLYHGCDCDPHGDQARENLTFRNPCKFKDCQFLVRFKRGLRLRIPLW